MEEGQGEVGICELQDTFDQVRWKVNCDVGQQGNVLRVTDPRSGSAD